MGRIRRLGVQLLCGLLAVLTVLGSAGSALADTVTPTNNVYMPTDDTFTQQGSDVPRPSGTKMLVKNYSATTNRNSYTQFDFSNFLGSSTPKAVLRFLLASTDSTVRKIDLYETATGWSESSLVWTKNPAVIGGKIASIDVSSTSPGVGQWIEYDVTEQVNAHLSSGNKLASFVLTTTTNAKDGDAQFYTKEEGPASAPQLVISDELPVPKSSPSNAAFTDTDAVGSQLGGRFAWTKAADESEITAYSVYFLTEGGTKLSKLGEASAGTAAYDVPAHTVIPAGAVQIGVYASNLYGDSKTGAVVPINDLGGIPLFAPSQLQFTDEDSVGGSIGGTVSWVPAAFEGGITQYALYFLDTAGAKLGLIGETAADVSSYLISPGTALPVGASKLGVYSKNAAGEMTQGAIAAFSDNRTGSVPKAAAFIDMDSTSFRIGGNVTWTLPASEGDITGYALYYKDVKMKKLSKLGEVSAGTSVYAIPVNTPIPSGALYISVIAINDSGETAEASDVLIRDRHPVVFKPQFAPMHAVFTDTDADVAQIAGRITWTLAMNEEAVSHYEVYFLNSHDNKLSRIGEVPAGTAKLDIPAGTAVPAGAVKLGVFSKNAAGEMLWGAVTPLK